MIQRASAELALQRLRRRTVPLLVIWPEALKGRGRRTRCRSQVVWKGRSKRTLDLEVKYFDERLKMDSERRGA
jgi:hypothetical protein